MRLIGVLVCLAGLSVAAAADDAAQVRELVAVGVLPKAKLQELREAQADSADAAILEHTLYGSISPQDLTEEQADGMIAAARRRLRRREERLAQSKSLVEAGALPRLALSPLLQDVDQERRAVDLAEHRARLVRELIETAHAEQALETAPQEVKIAERYDGDGVFQPAALRKIVLAYERQFGKALPISARGETAVHRSLGFDHRGRVDVALNPDQPEGAWLREYLESQRIPYFAFRASIPGKSTAPHIHIGPPSARLRAAD
jgi:hypothetical protein